MGESPGYDGSLGYLADELAIDRKPKLFAELIGQDPDEPSRTIRLARPADHTCVYVKSNI